MELNILHANLALIASDISIVAVTAAIIIYFLAARRYHAFILVLVVCLLSLETGIILKKFFHTARPNEYYLASMFSSVDAIIYSFPSLHTMVGFTMIPFVKKFFKRRWTAALVIAFYLAIALSRVLFGVHHVIDVIGGAIFGLIMAGAGLYIERRLQLARKFIYHLVDKLEVRRQTLHLAAGLTIVVLLKMGILNAPILFAIFIAGCILTILLRRHRLPVVYKMLTTFEREKDLQEFPGKGPLFMILGSLICVMVFEENIALAAISIMAVGDAVATIVGAYFGRHANPLNPAKHLEGFFTAVLFSTLIAATFVGVGEAFVASFVGMIFDVVTADRGVGLYRSVWRIRIEKVLDDNILIPLVAGAVLVIMGVL